MSAIRKRFIKEINKAMGEDVAAELEKLAEQARAIGRGEGPKNTETYHPNHMSQESMDDYNREDA